LNTKAIYAVGGGIAIAAVAAFFLLGGSSSPSLPVLSGGQNNNNSGSNTNNNNNNSNNTSATGSSAVIPPVIAVKNVTVTRVNETTNDTSGVGTNKANVQVTFTVKNPNKTTIILETIHYNVNVEGLRMTIGDVGQSAQGFLDSQGNLFPIVSGSTLTVKDTQTVERNSAIAGAWDRMVSGNASFTVDGTYAYRLTAANLQTTAEEKDFSLTFP
jgi:hypothetical protein